MSRWQVVATLMVLLLMAGLALFCLGELRRDRSQSNLGLIMVTGALGLILGCAFFQFAGRVLS